MRKPGLVVWRAHQAAAGLVRPGVTTRELDAAVEAVFCRYNAKPLFKGYPGAVPFPAATCISVNDEVVHGIPGDRKLMPGDIVSIDTGCQVDGWCGDSANTYTVGEVSDRTRRLLEVTQRVLQLSIDMMARCEFWSEVAREMERFVREAGFSVVEKMVGHGIGREMHESPQVPNYVSEDLSREDFQLRPGIVLAIEPMVNMGGKKIRCLDDQWTHVTCDGRPSAHFEHTVALTKGGPYILTGPPQGNESIE